MAIEDALLLGHSASSQIPTRRSTRSGTDRDSVFAVNAWIQGDFLCRNYILNGLDDSFYNVYNPITTVKKLWASLDKKYKTEDAGTKKFIVGRFLEYKWWTTRL